MKFRTLGSTGLSVSVIGVGTWQYGGEWGMDFSEADVAAILAAAKDCGINLIDTAECYGHHLSERLIGSAISGQRDQWIIASKFGHLFHGPRNRSEPRTPADIRQQTEESLAALKTDYLDIQQYHSIGDSQFFQEDIHAELLKLKDEGKFRFLGNSIGSNTNVTQIQASQKMGIEVIQIIYNRLDRAPESTTFPVCLQQNLGVLARVPLASGLLSGKYKPGHVFDPTDVRSHWKGMVEGDDKHKELEIVKTEVPPGSDMATYALAWCLKHPAVTSVIPGCKSPLQVRQNAAAANLL